VELADVLTNGFTEQELSRAVSAQQTGNDFLLDAAETRQDAAFADLYAGHFLAGADISTVEDAHQRIADVLASVSAAEVSENLTLALADSAPIIIVTGPDEDELPTVADLEAAVAAGEAAIGAPPGDDEDNTEVPTTLMERPEPVEESTSRDLPRLSPSGRNCGICETAPIELVFENGVTIRFVESTIASGQATLAAVSSGGWSTLPAGSSALAPIATAAVSGSGLGDVDRVSLERFLAANSAQVGPYIDETEEGFFGSTGVDDLETLFQLLHLLVTEPRVDEPALRSEVESARELNEAADTDGGVALELALREIRYGGAESQRLLATDEELDDIDEAEMLALYSERLGQVDDLVVAVVGDVDRQAVLDLSRSYLGTLPEGPSDTWIDVQPDAPAGVVEATIEVGTENSAGAVAMLSTSGGEISAGLRVASDLTRIILNARLFETLRESLAATYGGSVSIQLQTAPKSLAESLVLIEGDPERLDEIHAAVLAELGDLSTNGPTEEEFEQGRAVLRQDYALVNNGTAMELLLSPEQRPGEEVLDLDLRIEILEQLTAADIPIVAGALFPDDQRIDLFRVPAG
jgi:zinc protease